MRGTPLGSQARGKVDADGIAFKCVAAP